MVIPYHPQETGLRPGRVLRATVLEVRGAEVWLSLAGNKMMAESEIFLRPGEELQLRVKNYSPGRLVLQVLPDLAPALEEHLTEAARSLGLQLSPQQKQAVVAATGDLLPQPGELSALVWLAARGLPLTRRAVEAVTHTWQGPPLPTWQSLATSIIPALSGTAGERQGDPLVSLIPGLNWLPQDLSSLVQILPHLPARLGLNYEARLAAALQAGRGAGEPLETLAGDNLKGILLQLPESQTSGDLLARLTYLQLVSLADAAVVMVGWVATSEGQIPYLLKIKRDGGGRTAPVEGEDGTAVTIYTDPPRLGEVVARLRLAGEELTCHLACARPATCRLVNSRRGELEEMLSGLAPRVKVGPCILEPQAGPQVLATEFGFPAGPEGLDVRV